MKKKVLIGALALSATAVLGLTGCGGENDDPKKYTVTFDSNPAISTDDQVVEFEKGATQLDQIPIPVEKDGFAGVWESFTLEDKNITVHAKYGDGSAENPYLVANALQFKTILQNYTHASISDIPATVPHFKLLADIDLDIIDWNTVNFGGNYFGGVIDGNNYSIRNLSGASMSNTQGTIFSNIYNATFKNLKIYLGNYIGTLANNAKGGVNTFENVKVYNSDNINATIATADDNNESAFLNFVTGTDTVVNFINCENHANYALYSSNNGLFVGGYAKSTTMVNFSNCVNYGNIVSRGVVGMLFGNDSYMPIYAVTNCVFDGSVKSLAGSHVLCAGIAGTSAFGDYIEDYDANVDEKMTISGTLSLLDSKYSATIDGANITVSANEIEAGQYQLVLSSYAQTSNGTLLTNIVINQDKSVTDANSVVFENVLHGVQDLETYNATKQEVDKITSSYAQNYDSMDGIEWNLVMGYNIKYALVDGVYVVDYTKYKTDTGNDSVTINATASALSKTIIVSSFDLTTEQTSLDFIVNFS